MRINLRQQSTGLVKQAKVGFSWTTFFFGFFPAIFRGDWKWALIMTVIAFISCGLSWLVFPFIYNKLYIRDLLGKGYRASDEGSTSILKAKGIIVG
jgi:hypothetical protein